VSRSEAQGFDDVREMLEQQHSAIVDVLEARNNHENSVEVVEVIAESNRNYNSSHKNEALLNSEKKTPSRTPK
jgi:hypothetical protein